MKEVGIYKIENKLNGHCYIGSSKNIKKRWYEHRRRLKNNTHHSIVLQRAWNKYGEENFKFDILCYCSENELLIKEQEFFNELKPEYIILKIAGRLNGYKHTEETKKKIKEKRAKQIIVMSKERRDNISKAKVGKKLSPEHKKSLSKAKTNKKLSKEHKNKIRQKCTPEMMREKQRLSVNSRKDCNIIGENDNGEIIYQFNSLKEAYTELNICQSTLWRIIKNKRKFNNLIWKKQDLRGL